MDFTIKNIFKNNYNTTFEIDFTNCSNITDEQFIEICENNLDKLKYEGTINLWGCKKLTKNILNYLLENDTIGSYKTVPQNNRNYFLNQNKSLSFIKINVDTDSNIDNYFDYELNYKDMVRGDLMCNDYDNMDYDDYDNMVKHYNKFKKNNEIMLNKLFTIRNHNKLSNGLKIISM